MELDELMRVLQRDKKKEVNVPTTHESNVLKIMKKYGGSIRARDLSRELDITVNHASQRLHEISVKGFVTKKRMTGTTGRNGYQYNIYTISEKKDG